MHACACTAYYHDSHLTHAVTRLHNTFRNMLLLLLSKLQYGICVAASHVVVMCACVRACIISDPGRRQGENVEKSEGRVRRRRARSDDGSSNSHTRVVEFRAASNPAACRMRALSGLFSFPFSFLVGRTGCLLLRCCSLLLLATCCCCWRWLLRVAPPFRREGREEAVQTRCPLEQPAP